MTLDTAATLKEVCDSLGVPFIYKSSFDKANRSSASGHRGPGMEEGLRILSEVKKQLDLPVLTDVHEDTPMDEVAEVVDVLQTPAFLCRQTNFILRAAGAGKPVNIKKGQFLSPWEMQNVVDKAKSTGNEAHPGDVSADSRSATTTWSPICAALAVHPRDRLRRWSSTQPIRCSYSRRGLRHPPPAGKREFVPVLARAATAAGWNRGPLHGDASPIPTRR